nr:hypothetical protein [Candidatus Sigynarchaeota archaeon]
MAATNNCPRCSHQPEDLKSFQVFTEDYKKLCPACKIKAWKKDIRSFTIITIIGAVGTALLIYAMPLSLSAGFSAETLELTIYLIVLVVLLVVGVLLLLAGWLKRPREILDEKKGN